MNWLTLKGRDGHDYELRIKVLDKQTVYKIGIR